MKEIIMFTGENCGKCRGAKIHLGNLPPHVKNEVELIEINVDKDSEAMDFLKHTIKSNSLPTFMIEDSHGSYEYLDKTREAYIGFEDNIGVIMEYVGL